MIRSVPIDGGREAVVIGGTAVLAAASPGHAATITAAQAAAAKAKYIQASGYTGKEVHATWAGPSVGVVAWTVGSDFVATKTNAYRSCRTSWTGVDVDVSWNSESLHNGAKLAILVPVKLYPVHRSHRFRRHHHPQAI